MRNTPGDGNERVQNGGPEANSSGQAHEVAPAANPASDDAMAGADAPGISQDFLSRNAEMDA